ncbi:Uncharacterized protein OBRU01_20857 [Operophtera brumata]|uniref:Uncharacterized protein n=1 Tax=Operophtera brumata TaxID=104452 RepID=A0A0L7KTW9_OPEBR|nr:Uncharacterized protein OBRU01_20857 [Operophtera brumata]
MYLIDPGLCCLRARWSPALFAELRKTTLQALVCTLPLIAPDLVKENGLVRRLMWYIEWYSESPYELPILYWCLRLLQVSASHRGDDSRQATLTDLFDTHGQKIPPVEKGQAILSLALRLLTSAVEPQTRVMCCVYPDIKWPYAVSALARKMLDMALYSLENHHLVSDRWLIALLNFIWEAIIWKPVYREKFTTKDGIYKLLDIITHPRLVKCGATIATLLAAIFRDECRAVAILHMLSEDLECKAVLILCSYYMTLKLNEGRDEEYSLYAFLGRVRLNIALDALRDLRCVARSADRARITHALLQDAVRGHHRRAVQAQRLHDSVLRTYKPTLDDQVKIKIIKHL